MDNIKPKRKRKSKFTPELKEFIRRYIIKRIIICRFKLIKLIHKKFDIAMSKSSLYNIIKEMNITKRKIYYRYIPTNKEKRKKEIEKFIKKIKETSLENII
jgi:transposase